MGLWMLIWVERVREMWFVGLREVIVVEDAADGVRGRKGGLRGGKSDTPARIRVS